MKKIGVLSLPLLLLAACSTEEALPELGTLAAPADYIVSSRGALSKNFAATVAKNGDTDFL